MQEKKVTQAVIRRFQARMESEEKSLNTIQKYLRDVEKFRRFAGTESITKQTVIRYKEALQEAGYAVRSVNSMLASLNSLFAMLGWQDLRVRMLRTQKQIFRPEEKDLTKAEYFRLVQAAEGAGKERLSLILQTICATGIRISELPFVTVEAVRRGRATVCCKGKTRTVFLVRELQKKLLRYITAQQLRRGSVFVTRSGEPISRVNIWREMKGLCKQAQVNPKKVFPHNLRHLFAKVFYRQEKDVVKLADLLGHSSIETTRIYTVSTGDEHRRRLEAMHLIQ